MARAVRCTVTIAESCGVAGGQDLAGFQRLPTEHEFSSAGKMTGYHFRHRVKFESHQVERISGFSVSRLQPGALVWRCWTNRSVRSMEVAPLNNVVIPAASNFRAVVAQIFRYGISGGAAALLYSAIYLVLVSGLPVKPIVANVIAWLASLVSSYVLHSRWSFREQVRDPSSRQTMTRFLCVNLAGLALNSSWVWLFVNVMKFNVRAPLIPILLVTPWFMFYACRRWAFR